MFIIKLLRTAFFSVLFKAFHACSPPTWSYTTLRFSSGRRSNVSPIFSGGTALITAAALAICYSDFKGTKDSPIDMTAVQTVVNTLNTYNTTVYNNECTTIGQSTGCTSVYGLTMDHISKIRSSCGTTCQLVITGGTECWEHDVSAAVNSGAHIPGYPVVDLEKTTTLHTYIQNNMSQKICRQGWPTKTSSLDFPMNNCASGSAVEYWIPTIGIGFVDEGDHYHTTSNQGPSGSTVETVSH